MSKDALKKQNLVLILLPGTLHDMYSFNEEFFEDVPKVQEYNPTSEKTEFYVKKHAAERIICWLEGRSGKKVEIVDE